MKITLLNSKGTPHKDQNAVSDRKSRWGVSFSDDPAHIDHDFQPTIRGAIEEFLSCGVVDDEELVWPLTLNVFEIEDITAPTQTQAWDWFEEYFYDGTYEGFELPEGLEEIFKTKWAEIEATANSHLKGSHVWCYFCEAKCERAEEMAGGE